MANKVFMIHKAFDDDQRSQLLDAYPPRFSNVYCRHIVWAYNIPDEFVWPQGVLKMSVTGYHAGDGHDALVCCLEQGEETFTMQALGNKLLHVTLSAANGVPPASGGDIDPERIEWLIEPLEMSILLSRGHARKLVAELRA